ncbi:hypothetical protein HKX48_000160 [Thoreauomyces humboldtii]|nr:hypothetical protein HKX48_000160 [Thoreauomyces humboldtii]
MNREMNRLGSILTSPATSHMTESLNGVCSIRAFRSADRFIARQHLLTDRSGKSLLIQQNTAYWFILRVELLPSLVILSVLLLAGAVSSRQPRRDWLWDAEVAFKSVERLGHYVYDLPAETDQKNGADTPPDWPLSGRVEFKDVEIRYDVTSTAIDSGLSLSVASGEKLAICGRTGAVNPCACLFRIVDLTQGSITIDDIDTSTFSLSTLRSNLTVIPQEPILFSGTIRQNVDIRSSHTDDAICAVLSLERMKAHVSGLAGILDASVSNGTIEDRPRILVMDEALSSVECETDESLMRAVMRELGTTTVICIAHRLTSVAGFDGVAVIEDGRLVEADTPGRLLQREGGAFRSLVESMGHADATLIKTIVEEKESKI